MARIDTIVSKIATHLESKGLQVINKELLAKKQYPLMTENQIRPILNTDTELQLLSLLYMAEVHKMADREIQANGSTKIPQFQSADKERALYLAGKYSSGRPLGTDPVFNKTRGKEETEFGRACEIGGKYAKRISVAMRQYAAKKNPDIVEANAHFFTTGGFGDF